MIILLSAGHYPESPGACFEGFCEFDEALRWVDRISTILDDDRVIKVPAASLKSKVAFINARKAKLAVEIHFNSAKNAAGEHIGSGALTLHHPTSLEGKAFAELFQSPMESLFGRHWQGVMPGWYRMDEKFGPDFFLERTNCPAIIMEPEFIHHKQEIVHNREVACQLISTTIREVLNARK